MTKQQRKIVHWYSNLEKVQKRVMEISRDCDYTFPYSPASRSMSVASQNLRTAINELIGMKQELDT